MIENNVFLYICQQRKEETQTIYDVVNQTREYTPVDVKFENTTYICTTFSMVEISIGGVHYEFSLLIT